MTRRGNLGSSASGQRGTRKTREPPFFLLLGLQAKVRISLPDLKELSTRTCGATVMDWHTSLMHRYGTHMSCVHTHEDLVLNGEMLDGTDEVSLLLREGGSLATSRAAFPLEKRN